MLTNVMTPRSSPLTLSDCESLDRCLSDQMEMDELLMEPQELTRTYHLLMRERARRDLFYLLTNILNRRDAYNQWILDRCNEVQASPNSHLDLWAREHYKLLCDETLVATPGKGYVKHGDLRPGHKVFSPSGEVVKVLAVTGKLDDPEMYEVTFSNRNNTITTTIKCGADHLWDVELLTPLMGWQKELLSTRSLIKYVKTQQEGLGTRKIRIPFMKPKRQYWYITDIQPIKSVPSQCIQVEGGKYVCGKYNIPTHNSTIITFALTIQDILRTYGEGSTGEEYTIGIFSYVRPIAKDFLVQIKRELESNEKLKELFPDIFYSNPERQAPKWSDEAIIVKRKGNPKESVLEAWGVMEGQPTGRHFSVRVYDDVVTADTVKTEDRIKTTLGYWELSQAMGDVVNVERYIGTRYSYNDLYHHILKRGVVKPRLKPATADGTLTGKPVYWSQEKFDAKVKAMGSFTASCQLLQSPRADSTMGFSIDDLRYYAAQTTSEKLSMSRSHNRIILVDPSSGRAKKAGDYTAMGVWGLGKDNNYYLLDMVRDKIPLKKRTEALFDLHKKWSPIKLVGYEIVGMQSDVEHIQEMMEYKGYHFDVTEMGAHQKKHGPYGRIARLQPLFADHKIWLPKRLLKVLSTGQRVDLIEQFLEEEYGLYPFCLHDDALDMFARLLDPDLKPRMPFPTKTRNQGPKHIEYPQLFA